jgi:hypothetical protein
MLLKKFDCLNRLCGTGMKILAERIRRDLQLQTTKFPHCAIYEDELQRIWPVNEQDRAKKIAQFANEYGFNLSFYKHGLCAIFVEEKLPS